MIIRIYCLISFRQLVFFKFRSVGKTIIERTESGCRQSAEEDEYLCHVYVRADNVGGVLIADNEYPQFHR